MYGAIAYNGEKINEAQGRLLTTNRIYNDGSGTVDISKAMEGFHTFLPPQMKVEKPVVHISLNPHPEDVLTDIELQNIAREYLEKLGFGNQPYLVFKHVRLHLFWQRLAFLTDMPRVSFAAELLLGFVFAANPAVMPLLFLLFRHIPYTRYCFNSSFPLSVRRYFCFGWLGCSGYNGVTKPSFKAGCR